MTPDEFRCGVCDEPIVRHAIVRARWGPWLHVRPADRRDNPHDPRPAVLPAEQDAS